jgi:hypothetical protein
MLDRFDRGLTRSHWHTSGAESDCNFSNPKRAVRSKYLKYSAVHRPRSPKVYGLRIGLRFRAQKICGSGLHCNSPTETAGPVWVRSGSGVGSEWVRSGSGVGPEWVRVGPEWVRSWSGVGRDWVRADRFGPGSWGLRSGLDRSGHHRSFRFGFGVPKFTI